MGVIPDIRTATVAEITSTTANVHKIGQQEKKNMRIFRSTKDGEKRTWVNVDTTEKGKVTSQRVTLANEIPEEEWVATKNRFIDYVDIEPPTQDEMELVEEEVVVAEEILDKNGKIVFPEVTRTVRTLKIDN